MSSRIIRFGVEIGIFFALFSRLPIIYQILLTVLTSMLVEFSYSKFSARELKNELSDESIDKILENSFQQSKTGEE